MFERFTVRLGGIAVALLIATPALATDGKALPASACHPSGSVSFYYGRASNNGAGTATLDCPGVKDSIGEKVEKGYAWVIDQSFTDDVRCTLGVWSATTPTVIGFFETQSSVGTNPNPQQLSFASKNNNNPGYIEMRCTVPGVYGGVASQLVAYRVDEVG